MSLGVRRGPGDFALPLLAAAGLLTLPGPGVAADARRPGEARADSAPSAWILDPVEVRADPLPDPLGPFPLATRAIARAALDRLPGGDLGDALLPVAGVRVTSRGTPGAGAFASIRGSATEQVLVLVDGRRLNAARGGGVDLASLPVESIESVEVHRGGASALWGAAAIGGAIHLRTRAPRPGAAFLRVGGGSHGGREVQARSALGLGAGWRAGVGGRWDSAAGDFAYRDDRRAETRTVANGDHERFDADLRLEGPATSAARLRIDAGTSRGEHGVPGGEEFPTPTARLANERDGIAVRLDSAGAGRWRPSMDASVTRTFTRYREPGAAFGPIDESHRAVRTEASVALDRAGDAGAMRLAAGVAHDRLRSTTDGDPRRASADARVQVSRDVWRGVHAVRLLGAARLDAVEGFAPFVSPRLGAVAVLVPGRLRATVSGGLSFRTPGFDDLFWPQRASAAGNPGLRPERGRDLDLGVAVERLPLDGRVDVSVFTRTVEDLIQWVPGANAVWRPHNVGEARFRGVEAEAGAAVPLPSAHRLQIETSVTRLATEDRGDDRAAYGRELPYRPRWTAAGALRLLRPDGGEGEVAARFVDDVWVTRANTKILEGHLLVDARWRQPLVPGIEVDVAVLNVGDRTARDFRDHPLPGRTWQFGLAWRRDRS